MKNQIRAPKARKVNSYMVNSSNRDSSPFHQMTISDFPRLEKRNSDNNIHSNLLDFDEDDHICLESNESEFQEQVNKLSVISEILQIVSQPTSSELRGSIERCENPFSKNFPIEKIFENDKNFYNFNLAITGSLKNSSQINNKSDNYLSTEAILNEINPLKSDIKIITGSTKHSLAIKSDYENYIYKTENENENKAKKINSNQNDNPLKKMISENFLNQSNNDSDESYALNNTCYNYNYNYDCKYNQQNQCEEYYKHDMSIEELLNNKSRKSNQSFNKNNTLVTTNLQVHRQIKIDKGNSFELSNWETNKLNILENLNNSLIQRKRDQFKSKNNTLITKTNHSAKRKEQNGRKPFKNNINKKESVKDSPRFEYKLNNTILACIFSHSFYEYKVDAFPENILKKCIVNSHIKSKNDLLSSYLELAH